MRASLLADADFRYGIVPGLQRRDSAVDFLPPQAVIPDSAEDPEVLALAADLNRVLVSHDYKTMPGHFYRFLRTRESPELILIPQQWRIGLAVEELHLVWACQESEEFRNQIVYLPF